MAWHQTESGFRIWLTDSGNALLRDSGGNVYNTTPREAEELVRGGQYHPASPEQGRDFDKALAESRETVGEKAVALGRSVAAGIPDAFTGAGRALKAGKEVAEKHGLGGAVRAAEALAPAVIPGGAGMGLSLASQVAPAVPYEEALSGRAIQENVAAMVGLAQGREPEVAAREYREQVRAEAERHPLLTELGYAGGQVIGSALTPGLGEFMAAKGALGLAAKTGMAMVEGGAMGAAQQSEDAYVKNYDLTSEQALAGAGLASVLAGTAVMGLHGAGRIFRRFGSRGATSGIDAAVGESPTAAKAVARETAENSLGREATAEETGFMREIMDAGGDAKKIAGAVERRTETTQQFQDRSIERLTKLVRKDEDLYHTVVDRNVKLAQKAKDFAEHEVRAPEQVAAFRDATYRQLSNSLDIVTRITDDPELAMAAKGLVRDMRKGLERQLARTGKATTFEEVWAAADGIKRWQQRTAADAMQMATGAAGKRTPLAREDLAIVGRALDEAQTPIMNMLEDAAIVGQRSASAQRAINKSGWVPSFHDQMTGRQNLHRAFYNTLFEMPETSGTAAFGQSDLVVNDVQRRIADSRKIASLVRGLSDPANVNQRDIISQGLSARRNLVQTIGEHQPVGSAAAEHAQVVDEITRVLGEVQRRQAADTQLLASAQQIPGVGGLVRTYQGLKALTHSVAQRMRGSVNEELAGAAPPRSRAVQDIRQRVQARALPEETPIEAPPISERVPAPSFFGAGAGMVAKGIERTKTPAAAEVARRISTPRAKDGADGWREQAELVTVMRDDPDAVIKRASSALGSLPETMPNLSARLAAKAATGAQYLTATLGPMIPPRSPLQPNVPLPRLSRADQQRWDRIWDAVNSPASVLDDWRRGTVQQDQMDALRAVWPAIYGDLQQHAAEQIAARKTPLAYAQRRRLDMLLGLNGALEPTLSPDFLARTEARFQAQKNPPRPAPPPSGRAPRTAHLYDLSQQET